MTWAEEVGGAENRRAWENRFNEALSGRADLPEEERGVPISDLPRRPNQAVVHGPQHHFHGSALPLNDAFFFKEELQLLDPIPS